ncbi:DNA-directed RNA polymerase I subunit RPA2-like [Anneissia japonica]|uniref:DNA-directed RNA polymerase I subunit RPA2-like n=1 Tax=Anneissia japonica TaxID=1529436 RepID=UPI001425B467|nr:DNA-directed RNA polymerase I subunit RPA2-like [Anneissia japonica]
MESEPKSRIGNNRHLTVTNYGKPSSHQNQILQNLTEPHIQSFNYMLEEGLMLAVQNMQPIQFSIPSGARVTLSFQSASIGTPTVAKDNKFASTLKVFPAECRQRGITYSAKIQGSVQWICSDGMQGTTNHPLGDIPVMVKTLKS